MGLSFPVVVRNRKRKEIGSGTFAVSSAIRINEAGTLCTGSDLVNKRVVLTFAPTSGTLHREWDVEVGKLIKQNGCHSFKYETKVIKYTETKIEDKKRTKKSSL